MKYPIPREVTTLCAADPDLFFGPVVWMKTRDLNKRIEAAKAICRRCPFKDPCAAYALPRRVEGVWGATTEEDRKDARERLGIPLLDPEPLRVTGKAA